LPMPLCLLTMFICMWQHIGGIEQSQFTWAVRRYVDANKLTASVRTHLPASVQLKPYSQLVDDLKCLALPSKTVFLCGSVQIILDRFYCFRKFGSIPSRVRWQSSKRSMRTVALVFHSSSPETSV
jgi:hypothetical protein